MYLDYFGLKETPFSIAPDPRYLYMSERHREALAHLLYGVSGQGGFVVLTGEVGTGKTTICRCFLNQVPKNTDVAFIINPKLSARELMASICDELHIQYTESASIKSLTDVINRYLLNAHSENRHTVLIIDEAQNLRVDVLEQLRLLTNLETSEKKLLQIILLGQPELREILAQNELRQLAQRITARYHLHALNKMEVGAYVQCRLAVAGRRARLLDLKAVKTLYQLSGGIPRLINLICDRALLGAYASQSDMITVIHLQKAYSEIQGEKIKKPFSFKINLSVVLPVLVSLLIVAVGALYLEQRYIGKLDQAELNHTAEVKNKVEGLVENTVTGGHQASNYSDSNLSAKVSQSKTGVNKGAVTHLSGNGQPRSHLSGNGQPRAHIPVDDQILNQVIQKNTKQKSAPFLQQITGFKSNKRDKFLAYQAIFKRWGVNYDAAPFMLACDFAEMYGLRCLHKNGNWRSLLKLNRPAVLTLINEIGESLYFGLLAIEGNEALVFHQNKTFWVALDEIDRYWLGEYSVIWKLPPFKSRVIKPGQKKEAEWLRSNMARLNGSKNYINEPLTSQVKRFQLSVGLVPDGVVGSMTIIHMNSRLRFDCPKLLGGV